VLLGLSTVQKRKSRNSLLALFLTLGILGQATLAHEVIKGWKEVRSPSLTANLYAEPHWVEEWNRILDLSKQNDLLFLAYSTGVHHYFRTVESPDVWVLRDGQLLASDRARVIRQIDSAEVIVVDMTSPTLAGYPDIQGHLHALCLTQSTPNFQIWQRRTSDPNRACLNIP
jgi:hypothetical protein